eukprot:9170868-Pyramimonas_sp.AAC.1
MVRVTKKWELELSSRSDQNPMKKQRLLDTSRILLAHGLEYFEAVELGHIPEDDDDDQESE